MESPRAGRKVVARGGVSAARTGKRDDSSAGAGGRTSRNTNSTLRSDDKTDTSEAPSVPAISVNSAASSKSKALPRTVEVTKVQRPRGRGSPRAESTGGKSSEQQATKEDVRGGRAAPAARNVKLGGMRAAAGSPARQKPSAHTSLGTPVGQKPLVRRGGRGGGEASAVAACEDMSGKAGVGLGEGSAKSSDRAVRPQGGGGGEGQAKSRSLPGERRSAPNKGLHAAVGKSASLERGKVNPVVNESKGDARKPGERLLAKLSGLREKKAEVLTPHLTGSHQPFFQGINAPCSLPTSPRKVPKRRHESSAGSSNTHATSYKRRRQGLSLLPAIDPCTGRRRNLSSSDAEAIAGAVAGGDTKLLSTFYPDFPLGPVVYTVWERGEGLGSKEKMLKHRFVRCKPAMEQSGTAGVWARAGSEDTACDSSLTEAGSAGSFRPVAGSVAKVSSAGGRTPGTEEKTGERSNGDFTRVSCEPEAVSASSKSEVKLTSEPIEGKSSTVVEGDAGGRCRSPQDQSSPTASEKDSGQPTVIAVRGTPGK